MISPANDSSADDPRSTRSSRPISKPSMPGAIRTGKNSSPTSRPGSGAFSVLCDRDAFDRLAPPVLPTHRPSHTRNSQRWPLSQFVTSAITNSARDCARRYGRGLEARQVSLNRLVASR